MQNIDYKKILDNMVSYLKKKENILFLTTSNRWNIGKWSEIPKSTLLAHKIQELVWKDKVKIIDVPSLKIYNCEWNVSTKTWNTCWLIWAKLEDKEKNPTWFHRCWASINNPDDELWKVSKELFASDAVVFFWSIRRWQMNAFYQKLIERLTWIENRRTTLWDGNIVEWKDVWIVIVNQNWRWKEVLDAQRQVLNLFWFNVVDDLCWDWQYIDDYHNEDNQTYIDAYIEFEKMFLR